MFTGTRNSGRSKLAGLGLSMTMAFAAPLRAEDPPRRDVIELKRCQIEFSKSSLLGCPLQGVLKECTVQLGDRVAEGQVLGKLRDEDVVAEMEVRNITGQSFLPIELAQARKALADSQLLRAQGISKRGYLSDADLKTAYCEAALAKLDVETAKQQKSMAQVQVEQAQALIRFRRIVAPHAGVVTEILKTPGEGVIPNTPVVRVVDDNKMRVVGRLDVIDSWRVKVGQSIRVWPSVPGVHLPIEDEVFEGKVAVVDSQIDPLTHTCMVIAIVDNRDNLLKAGLEARMQIDPTIEVAVKKPVEEPKENAPKVAEAGPRSKAQN